MSISYRKPYAQDKTREKMKESMGEVRSRIEKYKVEEETDE